MTSYERRSTMNKEDAHIVVAEALAHGNKVVINADW